MTEALNVSDTAPTPNLPQIGGEPLVMLSEAVHAAMQEGSRLGLESALLADHVASRLHEAEWVHQPIIRTEEALDALTDGTTIRTERPRARGSLFFEKCGKGFLALDPSDRQDGEDLVSSGTVLRWMSTGFAVVVALPCGDRNGDAPGVNL